MDLAKLSLALQAGGAGLQGGDPGAVLQRHTDEQERIKRKAAVDAMLGTMGLSGPQQALIEAMPVDMAMQTAQGIFEERRALEEQKRREAVISARQGAAAAQKRKAQEAAMAAFQDYTKPTPSAAGPTMAAAQSGLSREAIGRALVDPRLTPEMRQQLVTAYQFQNPEPAEVPTAVQTLQARAEMAGLNPGTPEYQQFMLAGGKETEGFRLVQGEDGTFTFEQGPTRMFEQGDGPITVPTEPPRLGRKISENDAGLLKEAQTQAAAADSLNINITEAERIINEGMATGLGANVRAQASRVGAATGLTDGSYASQFQEFDTLSKSIGIDTLKALGGNDTERELMTAIQTTVSPTKEENANKRVIANKKAASDVIAQKPNLMSAWLDQYGSLNNSNDKGQTWDTAWREYQRDEYKRRSSQYASELGLEKPQPSTGGIPQGVDPDIWEYMTPEERALWGERFSQ